MPEAQDRQNKYTLWTNSNTEIQTVSRISPHRASDISGKACGL